MSLLEKIPAMSDGDLASLFANATRLSGSGNKKQKEAANELIPVINAESLARSEAKAAASAAARAARPKAKKKVAVVAPVAVVEEDEEEDADA